VRVRGGSGPWRDARNAQFDPTLPYFVDVGGGRSIAVFFYDGPIARAVAFGEALSSGDDLVARLEQGFNDARAHDEMLVVAVDGETFGHHKKGGDEVLASALRQLQGRKDLELVNLGQALEQFPPKDEAQIAENSSWSCAHGLERWKSDCGCHVGGQPGWRQAWRGPLRAALDEVRDKLADLYAREAGQLFADPWKARDEYIEVILDRDGADDFLARHAAGPLDAKSRIRALELCEQQRNAQLMYTSCGWFFAEISGLETVQILKYAARALQVAREATGVDLEPAFDESLSRASSNLPDMRDGSRVYDALVKPSVVTLEAVAAHSAISNLFDEARSARLFCYDVTVRGRRRERAGGATLAMSHIEVHSRLTGEQRNLSACVLHFSGADFRCGLRPFDASTHQDAERRLFARFSGLSLAQVVREIDRDFTGRDYTLRDLFLDERRRLAGQLLDETMRRYEEDYLRIYESNRRLIDFLREIDSPVPRPLQVAADVALTRQAQEQTRAVAEGRSDLNSAHADLLATMQVAKRLGARIDRAAIVPEFHDHLASLVDRLLAGARDAAAQIAGLLELAEKLHVHLDLWAAQNRIWDAAHEIDLDPDHLARLSRALWFDERTLATRALLQRRREPAPRAAAS